MRIAVSILKSKYDEEETIKRINKTEVDYIHLDIMDGKFVPQKTHEFQYLELSNKKLQVHLMVSNPIEFINKYNLPNVESIIIQTEIDGIEELITYIKSLNKKVGLALNPETNIDELFPYLDNLDYILVLTVHPGLGGQKMLKEVTLKIDELKKLREEKNLNFEIIVDGGVNDETIDLVKSADIAVVGSFICMHDDFNIQINKLKLQENWGFFVDMIFTKQ